MGSLIAPGWWRRNALALAAVVVTAAATVVVGVVVPLREDTGLRDIGRVVAPEETARVDGIRFRLEKTGVFDGGGGSSSIDVPKGSMLVAVLVRVTGLRGAGGGCSFDLVHDGTDKISWSPLLSPSTYGYGLSESTAHLCDLDATGPQTVEEVFLVPGDVYRRIRLVLTVTPEGGRTERIAFELPRKPYSEPTG